MSNKTLVASQKDYIKFKKLLQFFVRQANKNAMNGRAEKPVTYKKDDKFLKHYGLEPGFDKIAELDFGICFFMLGHYNTERSTYTNVKLFNIVAEFDKNKKITALQNKIILETNSLEVTGIIVKLCEEQNKKLKPRSIEVLGIDNDDVPNDSLKKMLDEFLSIYNEFHKCVECSTIKKRSSK